MVFFRIYNNSKKDLYVNIIDVDDDGKLSDCLPVDDGLTMSHLLIPAESVIDLSNYPVTLWLPQGTDHLILVAYDEPFDVRVVNSTLLTPGLKPVSSTVVGLITEWWRCADFFFLSFPLHINKRAAPSIWRSPFCFCSLKPIAYIMP